MENCLFCKIVKGEIPSLKVYEDADVYAFLDINPANIGHTLVIPKKHTATIFEIDEKSLQKVMAVVKKLAQRIIDRTGAHGINILQNNGQQAGQLVHHFHFHIIPRFENDHIIIKYPRAGMTEQQMKEVQEKLSKDEQKKTDYSSMEWNV
jgi:histidine triad (HIT) family protein